MRTYLVTAHARSFSINRIVEAPTSDEAIATIDPAGITFIVAIDVTDEIQTIEV